MQEVRDGAGWVAQRLRHEEAEQVLSPEISGVQRIDVRAEETVAFDWERWLRRNVIGKIPGASSDE